jgi:hypothetical protein
MHGCRFGIALIVVCCCADTANSRSHGPWQIPSRPVQCFGYGFGAGYHAPLVRDASCRPPHVARMNFASVCSSAETSACCYRANPSALHYPNHCGSGPNHCGNGMCASATPAQRIYPPQVTHQRVPHPAQPQVEHRGQQPTGTQPQPPVTLQPQRVFPGPPMPTVEPAGEPSV